MPPRLVSRPRRRVRSRARRYTYLPHQHIDEPDDALCRFLKAAGTYLVKWRLSFFDDIPVRIRKSRQGHINVGAFGRLDVPLIASTVLRKVFETENLDPTYPAGVEISISARRSPFAPMLAALDLRDEARFCADSCGVGLARRSPFLRRLLRRWTCETKPVCADSCGVGLRASPSFQRWRRERERA